MENVLAGMAEIDVNRIPWDKVISQLTNMYCNIPQYDGFHEWLVEIK